MPRKKLQKSKQLCIPVAPTIKESIDNFILNGFGDRSKLKAVFGSNIPDYVPVIDISRSSLIKFLITAFGDRNSMDADYIYNSIYADKLEKSYYLTILTDNPLLLKMQRNLYQYKLVRAMVACHIPILGYYDGYKLIDGDNED